MRETRGNFEVEVLRSTGARAVLAWLGARPVSDGPYQPVDAADVRRRDVFGARQDNEFAVRHCCVRKTALVRCGRCARCRRGTSKPTRGDQFGERARRRRTETQIVTFASLTYLPRKISNIDWRSSRSPPTERKGFQWRIVSSTLQELREFVCVRGCRIPPRSIGT